MRERVAEQPDRSAVATGGAGARGAALAPPAYGIECVDAVAPARASGRRVVARQVDEGLQSSAPSGPPAAPLFPTEYVGGLSVVLGKGETIATLARRHYGHQEKEFVDLIREANGLDDRAMKRLQPGRGIAIPAIRRPADVAAPAAREVAADQVGVVPFGQVTYDAEGQEAPGAVTHSRKIHVPSDTSGVTIGRGYDLGKRRGAQVRAELAAAGVSQATAATLAGGVGLTGDDARAFRRTNSRVELTQQQQWNLFVQEYHRLAASTQLDILRWELSRPEEQRIDPASIDTTTAELLVDLRFRGDLSGRVWTMLRPHLNDAAALGEIVRQRSNFPSVPRDRYERRCRHLGVEPEPEPGARQVQRASAGGDALAGTTAPQIVHAALASPSQPLTPALRQQMQSQLGHDFGGVRVHTGALADASARAVGAVAYTVGEHVVFRERAFAPETARGREVLAHELVHTSQQAPLAGASATDLTIGDPHAAEEHEAQRRAQGGGAPVGERSGPVLRRQKEGEAPAPSGPTLEDVLKRAGELAGLPYAFSEADTVKTLDAKIAALAGELDKLAKPGANASADDKAKYAARKQQLTADLAGAQTGLVKAKQEHADARVVEVLKQRQGTELGEELKSAVRQYGVVCNVFVELTMRTSGFSDFPVTGQAYAPQSAKYKEIEGKYLKDKKARSGWGLEWHERMVDWATMHGSVLYDDTDAAKKTLPEPRPGDIVLFLRPNGRYHVSMVVEFKGGFNFMGARSSGKLSGTSLTVGFKTYGDTMNSKGGKQDLPTIMGQVKYMYILRPTFGAKPPPLPAAVEE